MCVAHYRKQLKKIILNRGNGYFSIYFESFFVVLIKATSQMVCEKAAKQAITSLDSCCFS